MYDKCSRGRDSSAGIGNIIKLAKLQGVPRSGEREAAAGVIEVPSDTNSMNSLRVYVQ